MAQVCVQEEGMLTRRRTRRAVRDSSVPRNGMTLADLSELASQMQQEEEKEAPSTEGSTGSRGAPDLFQSIPRGRRRPSHQSSPCTRALHTSAGTGRHSRDSQASPTASPGAMGSRNNLAGPPEGLPPIWPRNGARPTIALGPATPSPPGLFNPVGALAALLSPSESAPVANTGGGPLPRNVVQNLLLLSLKRDPGCVVLASILAASPGLLRQLVSALTLVMEHEEKARAAAAAADTLGGTVAFSGELDAWRHALSLSRNQPDRKARLTGVKREAAWPPGRKKTADLGGASIVGGRRIQVSPVIPSPKEVIRLHTAEMHGYEGDQSGDVVIHY